MTTNQKIYTFHANDENDTVELANIVAKWSHPGMVITLDGDLGAGKTRFSQAFARSIGVHSVVNSPTFTIIKEYEGEQYPLYHMDVYRLTLEEASELGLDEYFFGEGITLVEWASLIDDLLPPERLEISIERVGEHQRKFTMIPRSPFYEKECVRLREKGVFV